MHTDTGARLAFLDVAKGIGMVLVVFAHVNFTPGLLIYAYSFHMPLFFILSGMLYNKDRYTSFSSLVRRKLETLVCPYIFFSLLALLFSMAADYLRVGMAGLAFKEYLLSFGRIVLSQGSQTIVNAALWFLTCLFVVEALYYWISKLKTVLIVVISVGLSCIGWLLEAGCLGFDSSILPWSLDSALFCMGFFALGHLLGDTVKKGVSYIAENKYKVLICLGVLGVCLAVQIPVAFWNGKVSIGSKNLGNGLLLYITGIFGTGGLLAISILLMKSRFLSYCGRNSLYILCIHWIILNAILVICLRVPALVYDKESILQTLIPFIIVMIGSLLFVAVYTKVKKIIFKNSRQPAK